uniref:Cytochrome P450 n=1 Tax=Kalanchoe fedtschenkoi TaxID=63787 RepID=A0A7N0V052_KALFE
MDVITVTLCLLITTSLCFIIPKAIKQRYSNLPPGPTPLPVIGSLHLLGTKPHKSLAKLAQTHGPIMTLKLGQITAIVISSASAARLVLQKQDHLFANRSVPDSLQACDHGKLSVAWIPLSPKWRELRKICSTYIFSSQKMEANSHLMMQKVEELIADVRKKCTAEEPVLIGEAAFKTSMNLLSRVILSTDLADGESEASREFKKSFWDIMELGGSPNLVDFFPWLERVDPQRIRARMEPHCLKMLSLMDRLIDQRLARRAEEASGFDKEKDVLDSLLDIMQDSNEVLTRNEMNHLLQDLFVAGTDTTASTLEWAMSEVLKNPEIYSKAKSELEQVTGKGKPVQDADVALLPYLQAIVNETLRLHPPTPLLLPRKTLEAVELSGFTVPKGAQVMVNAWAIGRDSTTWDDPECFKPERFLGSNVSFVGGNFEVIPFGGGRRICPGLQMAVKMLQSMLGSLINCFDWKLEDGQSPEDVDMDDKFGITLQKSHPLKAIPSPVRGFL